MTNFLISSSHFKHFNAINFSHMINGFDVKVALNHYPTNKTKKNRKTHTVDTETHNWQREGFGELDEKGKGIKQNKLVVTE